MQDRVSARSLTCVQEHAQATVTNIVDWPGLPEDFKQSLEKARRLYESEVNVTADPQMLEDLQKTNPDVYVRLQAFLSACEWRLGLRWTHLPAQWTQRQAAALCKRKGRQYLDDSDGIYFVCPKCMEIRADPVDPGIGSNQAGFYAEDVCLFVRDNKIRRVCRARNLRAQEASAKRNKRNNPNCNTDKSVREMCNGVELIRVCMVGILLYTTRNKLVVLCADCGTLMKWVPSYLTPDGPTCGCRPPREPPVSCDICTALHPFRNMRKFMATTPAGLREIAICANHRVHLNEGDVPSLADLQTYFKRSKAMKH